MSKHWSTYMIAGATQPQCDLLDRLAKELDAAYDERLSIGPLTDKWRSFSNGRDVLEAEGYKRDVTKGQASMAIDAAKERLEKRRALIAEAKANVNPRSQAIETIHRLMAEHAITVTDLV